MSVTPEQIAALTDRQWQYGDVIGHPRHPARRAVYLPYGNSEEVWLTRNGWQTHEWALERLEDGWTLHPDRQEDATK